MYSDLYIKREIKIPTWVFLLVIFTSFFLLSKFFSANSTPSKAAKKNLRELRYVNVSSNRFGVYWQTQDQETNWLLLGENETSLTKTVNDERDLAEKKGRYFYHYALLKDLQANKKYYFKIMGKDGIYSNNGKAYSFQTPQSVQLPGTVKPAYGKVSLPSSLPGENVFVLFTYNETSYPLLTLTKTSGEWLIPLSGIIDQQTGKNITPQTTDKVKLEIISDANYKSTVEVLVANLSPLPQTIILGKDYAFLENQEVLGAADKREVAVNIQKIDILYPKEGAVIAVNSPLLKGVALPGKKVMLELIADKKYYPKVEMDKEGVWKSVADIKLPAGKVILNLTTQDEKNKEIKLTRNFSIAKSGEQVLGTATVSATVMPTAAIIASPTVKVATSTPVPTLKVAGSNYLPFIISGSAMMILGLGVMFIF